MRVQNVRLLRYANAKVSVGKIAKLFHGAVTAIQAVRGEVRAIMIAAMMVMNKTVLTL